MKYLRFIKYEIFLLFGKKSQKDFLIEVVSVSDPDPDPVGSFDQDPGIIKKKFVFDKTFRKIDQNYEK